MNRQRTPLRPARRPEATITCPCCRGSGSIPLTGVYAETLALLREQGAALNGAAMAKLAGCKAPAMNNRLVRLEELGLAVGEPYGRQLLWRAAQ